MAAIDFSRCVHGQLMQVIGFAASMDAAYRHRLLTMGLTPHSQMRFVRRAPLGDPIVLLVRGSQLCLRQDELQQLQLELISG